MGNILTKETNGNITTYIYDSLGRLIEERLPRGNGTKYAYDMNGNRTMIRKKADITFPDNDAIDIVTRIVYNSKNLPTEIHDPRGKITRMSYDVKNNLIASREYQRIQDTQTEALLRETLFTYDTDGNIIQVTDPRGKITRMDYQSGRLVSQTDGYDTPLAATTTYTYDDYGNLRTMTDPRGNTTHSVTDAFDRVTRITTPEGVITEKVYDPNNNITRSIIA